MIAALFRTRYRIVRDNYLGFSVQFRRWWMPCYLEMWGRFGPANTHISIEDAEQFIRRDRERVVLTDAQLQTRTHGGQEKGTHHG